MVHAAQYSANERDFLSFVIAKSASLEEDELNEWISLIAKADAISYSTLRDKALVSQLDAILKSEDATELFSDINDERAGILSATDEGSYDISSGIWFTMLAEKINMLSKAENILLNAMEEHAKVVRSSQLH